jgi:hydrogenase-4 component E
MRLEAGAMAVAIMLLKGWVFPRLLLRALREAETTREVQPLIGHGASLFAGVAMLWVATALALRLPRTNPFAPDLLVPVALSLLMTGIFLIIARRTAVSQVIGYLVLENGIYALGLALVGGVPLLIELGALMDLFVGVFAMGIAIFRINRAFDHIDADRLTALRG